MDDILPIILFILTDSHLSTSKFKVGGFRRVGASIALDIFFLRAAVKISARAFRVYEPFSRLLRGDCIGDFYEGCSSRLFSCAPGA